MGEFEHYGLKSIELLFMYAEVGIRSLTRELRCERLKELSEFKKRFHADIETAIYVIEFYYKTSKLDKKEGEPPILEKLRRYTKE